ncbi:uncharacterized protein LOC144124899 [Amblyomma americanum]
MTTTDMHAFRNEVKATALQLVKNLECPICLELLHDPLSTSCHHRFCRLCLEKTLQDKYKIPCPLCKAVVTKRSLTQSDLIVKLVEKIKELAGAIKSDFGLDVVSPRNQHCPGASSREERSVHSHAPVEVTTPKSSLSSGSCLASKRAFSAHVGTDVTGVPSKRSRSGSTTVTDGPPVTEDAGSLGGNSSRNSKSSRRNAKGSEQAVPKRKQDVGHAMSSTVPSASIAADNASLASLCSERRTVRSDVSEAPVEVQEQPLCTSGGSGDRVEKVQNWLEKCDGMPQANSTSGPDESSAAQQNCSDSARKPTGSNRFFTSDKQSSHASKNRNAVLDASDTDPYKFIPSQHTLHAARRGRRKRLRGNSRTTAAAKSLSRRKSDRQNYSDCEFGSLRELCAQEEAREKNDAEELDIELFVTPGIMPCVSKKPVTQKRTSRGAGRRSKRIKTNLQLKPLEKQAEELQRKIAEAEKHELTIVKTVEGKRSEQVKTAGALKDVSNLRAHVEDSKGQNTTAPSSRKVPQEEENSMQQIPTALDKRASHSCKRSAVLHSETHVEPMEEKDVVDLCSADEESKVEAAENCVGSLEEDIPAMVVPDETAAQSDIQSVAAVTTETAVINNPCSIMEKGTENSRRTPAFPEEKESEESSSGRALSLKDFEGMFKKSSRKTFDLNASTQDLESLTSVAVDTLELMTDVCNSLKQPVSVSEPDMVPSHEEEELIAGHHDNSQQQITLLAPEAAAGQNNTVDQCDAGPCNDGKSNATKNREVSSYSSSSSASSLPMPPLDPSVNNALCSSCHLTNTHVACPGCKAYLSVACVNGVIKITLKDQPQKPVLVDIGMCTEKPCTKVIICREAVTQTESLDTADTDTESSGKAYSDVLPCQEFLAATNTKQGHATVDKSGTEGKALKFAVEDAISKATVHIEGSSPGAPCGGLVKRPLIRNHTGFGFDDRQTQGTEILCENTEDQAASTNKPSHVRASQFGLGTIIEDTEEMDTTPAMQTNTEQHLSNASPVQSLGKMSKHVMDEDRDVLSELQCSAEKSLLKSQNAAVLKRENSKGQSKLASECSETSLTSDELRKLRERKEHMSSNSDCSGIEALIDNCSEETYLPSRENELSRCHNEECGNAEAMSKENSSCQLSRAPPVNAAGNTSEVEASHGHNFNSSEASSLAAAKQPRESDAREGSSPAEDIACSPTGVNNIEANGSNHDGGLSSGELSPWSSPIMVRKVSSHARNGAKKIVGSSDSASEEAAESCEVIKATSKASSGLKTSRRLLNIRDESDSDSDPVSESEAEELLRRAAQDNDSEEPAVIFAKRAVAPLESSRKRCGSELQTSKTTGWLAPEKIGNIKQPVQQPGMPSQGKYSSVWKKHDSSINDGDNSDNTDGRSMATTMSSTLSEGLDRTLKEKLLEQDIEEMKKEMLMLENELQKTAVKKATDAYLQKDCIASNSTVAAATHGKDDNWDWDDSDEADEAMDFVPPTPPRKSRSSSDESFCSGAK